MVIRIFITLREVLIFMPHILAALTPGVEEAADSAASGRGRPNKVGAFEYGRPSEPPPFRDARGRRDL